MINKLICVIKFATAGGLKCHDYLQAFSLVDGLVTPIQLPPLYCRHHNLPLYPYNLGHSRPASYAKAYCTLVLMQENNKYMTVCVCVCVCVA